MQMNEKVLDHGYVKLIETWGSDQHIIEAARMSTAKGFNRWGAVQCPDCKGEGQHTSDMMGSSLIACTTCDGHGQLPGDEKLLAYLYHNHHLTPFEMAGMIIEVKAPIFVFREWHRHRTQSYNEMSARYVPLPDENYVPDVWRIMMQGGSNKQAQGTGTMITEVAALGFQGALTEVYRHAENVYQLALQVGVPKELARLMIPVARYSRMRASTNLRNWLGFLTLRDHPAAQWEIQQYAKAVDVLVAKEFPRTHHLYASARKEQ